MLYLIGRRILLLSAFRTVAEAALRIASPMVAVHDILLVNIMHLIQFGLIFGRVYLVVLGAHAEILVGTEWIQGLLLF